MPACLYILGTSDPMLNFGKRKTEPSTIIAPCT